MEIDVLTSSLMQLLSIIALIIYLLYATDNLKITVPKKLLKYKEKEEETQSPSPSPQIAK
ncbi:hypothetical protein EB118_15345 [bacterium]|nr:hypothetical protein [bacterium]NDD84235.1 hypothetical protein [bacterium]NDG31428.1 hypothetical protein [bacterium]